LSKNKKLLNVRKPRDYQKTLHSELELLALEEERGDYWVERGSLQTDLKQCKLMSSKVTEIRPINSMYFTYEELFKHSGLSREKFHEKCWQWYISLEDDDWDLCIELCGLCAIMADKYKKYWYPKDTEWKN
jgi:hypothetical protein